VEENKFTLTIQDKNLTIDMPEVAFYIEGIQIAKRGIALDIQKFIPDLAETKFVEAFKAEPKPVAAAPMPALEAPAPEAPVSETPVPETLAPETPASKP
jgi:hypothetical protein